MLQVGLLNRKCIILILKKRRAVVEVHTLQFQWKITTCPLPKEVAEGYLLQFRE